MSTHSSRTDSARADDPVPPVRGARSRARLATSREADGRVRAELRGGWTLVCLVHPLRRLRRELNQLDVDAVQWDLRAVEALDTAGALVLWETWGRRFPPRIELRREHRTLFDLLPAAEDEPASADEGRSRLMTRAAAVSRTIAAHLSAGLELLGRVLLDSVELLAHPRRMPWRETSSVIHHAGVRALGITALVGLLVGVVLAYQSARQLQEFGADIFVIDILALSIVREMGPLLAAVIVAGRSGSSMTAQLGLMRVTQELDAMTVMGMSITERLVLPRVLGLVIVLPLLTIWVNLLGLVGGILTAWSALGLPPSQFVINLPERLPIENLWIGLGKAAVFGGLIGMTAAHFGLRVEPNSQSLARETTNAVVTAITAVIGLDAAFSIIFQDVGWD